MSAPQWKPGDVAHFGSSIAMRTRKGWAYLDGSMGGLHQDAYQKRPLVVIDAEDREQVERLARAWCEQFSGRSAPLQPEETWHMQAALRSLVADPKPEEPQGLGAVVEDAEGERFVRYGTHSIAPWRAEDPEEESRPYRYYKDLDIVRVLSEGVER